MDELQLTYKENLNKKAMSKRKSIKKDSKPKDFFSGLPIPTKLRYIIVEITRIQNKLIGLRKCYHMVISNSYSKNNMKISPDRKITLQDIPDLIPGGGKATVTLTGTSSLSTWAAYS